MRSNRLALPILLALLPLAAALPVPELLVWRSTSLPAPGEGCANYDVRDVDFATASDGVLVGSCNLVLVTRDGGAAWASAPETTAYGTVRAGDFPSPGLAVVVGGNALNAPTAFRSTDGGETWARQSFYFRRVEEIDASVVNVEGVLTDVRVLPTRIFATGDADNGEGVIARSADGGRTWSTYPWASKALLALDFAPGDRVGIAVGEEGVVMRTLDGGARWKEFGAGVRATLRDVEVVRPGEAWAVGATGVVLRSADDGATWTRVQTGSSASLHAVLARDGSVRVAGDDGTILRSTDGGLSWLPEPTEATGTILALAFTPAGRGFAGAEQALLVAERIALPLG